MLYSPGLESNPTTDLSALGQGTLRTHMCTPQPTSIGRARHAQPPRVRRWVYPSYPTTTVETPPAEGNRGWWRVQIAASDPRHTMATLARAWRRQAEQPVEMVVWEPSLEGLARHMLLLSIMLDTQLTARGAYAP
jgi:hypothetical protein